MAELLLGVNIDHIATLRNARGTDYPDPVQAAFIAEQAGADGITVHLREDRRHITDRDVRILRQTLHTRMNLESKSTRRRKSARRLSKSIPAATPTQKPMRNRQKSWRVLPAPRPWRPVWG